MDKDCRCQFCLECLFQHYKQLYVPLRLIKCPMSDCQNQYNAVQLQSLFARQKQVEDQYVDLLFNYYLHTTFDIRSCSQHNCNYKGFVINKQCPLPLQCNLCGTKWTDYEMSEQKLRYSGKYKIMKFEFLSLLKKLIITSPCPNCQINIIKGEGCSNMQCMRCLYNFCWTCKQSSQFHTQEHSMVTYMFICLTMQCDTDLQIISPIVIGIQYILVGILSVAAFFASICFFPSLFFMLTSLKNIFIKVIVCYLYQQRDRQYEGVSKTNENTEELFVHKQKTRRKFYNIDQDEFIAIIAGVVFLLSLSVLSLSYLVLIVKLDLSIFEYIQILFIDLMIYYFLFFLGYSIEGLAKLRIYTGKKNK